MKISHCHRKRYWWKNHRVNGSGIAENIAVYVAAELMKTHRESWSGIDEKHRV